MHAEALRKADQAEALAEATDDQTFLAGLGWVYGTAGQRPEALRILGRQQQLSARRWVDPIFLAWIYVGLQDYDNAFKFVRQAYEQRTTSMVFMGTHPMLDGLRSDPRYGKLMKDMGFEK